MSDRPILSTLASRLRVPVLAGLVAGLVSGGFVIAALIWRDGLPRSHAPDPDEIKAAIADMRRGGIGHVDGPYGTITTMGLGRTPGLADPADDQWFWQRIENLDARTCETVASDYLERPDTASLRIGSTEIQSLDMIPQACADHDTVSRVLSFGETL